MTKALVIFHDKTLGRRSSLIEFDEVEQICCGWWANFSLLFFLAFVSWMGFVIGWLQEISSCHYP